jgi:hypothetical protein
LVEPVTLNQDLTLTGTQGSWGAGNSVINLGVAPNGVTSLFNQSNGFGVQALGPGNAFLGSFNLATNGITFGALNATLQVTQPTMSPPNALRYIVNGVPVGVLDASGNFNITGQYMVNGVPISTGGGGLSEPVTLSQLLTANGGITSSGTIAANNFNASIINSPTGNLRIVLRDTRPGTTVQSGLMVDPATGTTDPIEWTVRLNASSSQAGMRVTASGLMDSRNTGQEARFFTNSGAIGGGTVSFTAGNGANVMNRICRFVALSNLVPQAGDVWYDGTSFNFQQGGASVTLPANFNFLPLTGGAITGNLSVSGTLSPVTLQVGSGNIWTAGNITSSFDLTCTRTFTASGAQGGAFTVGASSGNGLNYAATFWGPVTLRNRNNLVAYNNLTPANGDLWYDGTTFNIRQGGTTYPLPGSGGGGLSEPVTLSQVLTANGGITTTTGTFSGATNFNGNMTVGGSYRINANGTAQLENVQALTNVSIGNAAVFSAATPSPANGYLWFQNGVFQTRQNGVTGLQPGWIQVQDQATAQTQSTIDNVNFYWW